MASNIQVLIESAKRLKHEVTRIGKRSGSASVDDVQDDMEIQSELQAGAVPVSAPDNMRQESLHLTFANSAAQEDLGKLVYNQYYRDADISAATRLQETKEKLLDLCQRQLDDLLDDPPSGSQTDIEDVESLVSEMKGVKRCMETVVGLERALRLSQ